MAKKVKSTPVSSSKISKGARKLYCVFDASGKLIGHYCATRVPLIVVQDYCDKNKGLTYLDLTRLFNEVRCYHMLRYEGMIVSKSDVEDYEAYLIANGYDPNPRVHKYAISLTSGEVIYVTNQWSQRPGENFDLFVDIAKKLGYRII